MAQLYLYGKTTPDCLMYIVQRGKPVCLSRDQGVVIHVAAGESVSIHREKPLSVRWKVLGALGIFVTAPIQVVLQQDGTWEGKNYYDIQVTLTPKKDTACTIEVKTGEGMGQPPRVKVVADGLSHLEVTCTPSLRRLDQAWFIYLCRLVSIGVWGWMLMGMLFWAALCNGLYLGAAVSGAVCLGIVGVCLYCGRKENAVRQKCRQLLQKAGGNTQKDS